MSRCVITMSRKLDVFLHNRRVGVLEQFEDASLSFAYSDDYLADAAAMPVSVSMPLVADTYDNSIAKPFFSGLLPDESARQRLAKALGISDTNAFGMLEIIGGECAGALALYQQDKDTEIQSAGNLRNCCMSCVATRCLAVALMCGYHSPAHRIR